MNSTNAGAASVISGILVALGITLSPPEMAAGLLLGLVISMAIQGFVPSETRLDWHMVPALSVVWGVLAAMAHPKWAAGVPPVLLVASVSGLSAFITRILIAVLMSVSGRSDRIADKALDKFLGGKK